MPPIVHIFHSPPPPSFLYKFEGFVLGKDLQKVAKKFLPHPPKVGKKMLSQKICNVLNNVQKNSNNFISQIFKFRFLGLLFLQTCFRDDSQGYMIISWLGGFNPKGTGVWCRRHR